MNSRIKTIGIIGGGQLGMMLVQAAHQLGYSVAVLEKSLACPAYGALDLSKDRLMVGELSDYSKLLELANCSEVLTFEIEHIDTQALIRLESETGKAIYPSPKTLEIINDKFTQKTQLKKAGLPVGKFEPIRSLTNLDKLIRQFSFPMLIKSRKGGYDGGGNFVIKTKGELDSLVLQLDLQANHHNYFVEKFVRFEREISVLLARSIVGEVVIYPVIDTFQQNSICTKTIVPSTLSLSIQEKATLIATQIINSLDYVGVMAVEMFVLESGEISVNEIAPRVHNSGHWTMSGCVTSQFEQHIRCISGMALGSVESKYPSTLMYNIFGSNYELIQKLQTSPQPNVLVYDYNKSEIRSNRKMGHINIVGESRQEAEDILNKLTSSD
jgi:phosphoribosylaminoimidazole carboxylase PurK protein